MVSYSPGTVQVYCNQSAAYIVLPIIKMGGTTCEDCRVTISCDWCESSTAIPHIAWSESRGATPGPYADIPNYWRCTVVPYNSIMNLPKSPVSVLWMLWWFFAFPPPKFDKLPRGRLYCQIVSLFSLWSYFWRHSDFKFDHIFSR